MVKVRLARAGSKKRPFYHIVVTDKENPRDGRFIESLGYYDPSRPITEAKVDRDRLAHWVGLGAQVSERVSKVVAEYGRAAEAASA
jgi:small subunit ribosomal protein S16